MDNAEYNLPDNVDLYSEQLANDFSRRPAVNNISNGVYILRDNKIVCEAMIGSSYRGIVRVYLKEEGLEIFKDDYAVRILGKHASFPFHDVTGFYAFGLIGDDPEDRGVGLTIVDKLDFDFGFASRMRYSHIPGFANRTKGD